MILRFQMAFIIIGLFMCCKQDSCSKYEHEVYSSEIFNMADSIKIQLKEAYTKFEEPVELTSDLESYRMLYAHSLSSHSNLWTFEKNINGGTLIFKEFGYDPETKSIKVEKNNDYELSIEDWQHVEYLFKKNNFWTAVELKQKHVADGGGYIIEGYRPDAKSCNKLDRKAVYRSTADSSDKINWLCSDLISIYIYKSSR